MSKDTEILQEEPTDNKKNCMVHASGLECQIEKPSSESLPCKQINVNTLTRRKDFNVLNFGFSIHNVVSESDLVTYQALHESKAFSHIYIAKKVSKGLSNVLLIEQHHCCLSMVKLVVEVAKCLKTIKIKLHSLFIYFKNIQQNQHDYVDKLVNTISYVAVTLTNIIEDVDCTLLQITQTFPKILKSQFFNQLLVKWKQSNSLKQQVKSCQEIMLYLQGITSELLKIQAKLCGHGLSITSTLYVCKTLMNKLTDFAETLSMYFRKRIVLYPKESSKCHLTSQKSNYFKLLSFFVSLPCLKEECMKSSMTSISNICDYVKEISKKRSLKLSSDLSLAVIEALKNIFARKGDGEIPSVFECKNLSSNNFQLTNANIKSVLKLMKNIYRRILVTETSFFGQLLEEIEHNGNEILKHNTNVLFKKLQHINGGYNTHRCNYSKIVSWESTIGPIQKDFLFGIYMEELWCHVKKHLNFCYILSVYEMPIATGRMNNYTLNQNELDLLWQIQVKLANKDKLPQTFFDTLSVLSTSMSSFHTQQFFDLGMCKAMGLSLKDRFRYIETNIGSPTSQTITSLFQSQVYIQVHFKCLQKYKQFDTSELIFCQSNLSSMLRQIVIFHSFLDIFLLSKRHQFLVSATWEKFFVITTSDIKITLLHCQRIMSLLKDMSTSSVKLRGELGALDGHLLFLELFEKNGIQLMIKHVTNRSRDAWKEHMAHKKIWKRRGSRLQIYEASSYINVVMQVIFAPILESSHILKDEQKISVLCKCIVAFIRTWMDHIMNKQFTFSRFGAQQLDFDFTHFVTWFENEEFGFSLEEISEMHSLPVLSQMKNAIILLACQPDGRKSSRNEDSNLLLSNNFGSSSSVMSQVSLESFTGSQYEDIIKEIDIHDKERWLALRAKGGFSKRFLCIS